MSDLMKVKLVNGKTFNTLTKAFKLNEEVEVPLEEGLALLEEKMPNGDPYFEATEGLPEGYYEEASGLGSVIVEVPYDENEDLSHLKADLDEDDNPKVDAPAQEQPSAAPAEEAPAVEEKAAPAGESAAPAQEAGKVEEKPAAQEAASAGGKKVTINKGGKKPSATV